LIIAIHKPILLGMEHIENTTSPQSPRLTRSRAIALLAEQSESGLSTAAFAAQHGLRPRLLYRWRNRLRSVDREDRTSPSLINVTASVACDVSSPSAAVLTFANGMRLEGVERLSPEQLRVLCAVC
jgi:transposase-like protein